MSEYHKIETLYERDEQTFRLKPELVLKNRTYSLIKTWNWTEKIDGTNIRCIWDHITGKVTFGSKSDNAQIHADLVRYLYENIPVENVRGVFPDVSAVLYGEGYGAGIQKGGDYSDKKEVHPLRCVGGWQMVAELGEHVRCGHEATSGNGSLSWGDDPGGRDHNGARRIPIEIERRQDESGGISRKDRRAALR